MFHSVSLLSQAPLARGSSDIYIPSVLSLFFLVNSFRDLLMLEEPVKVLNVGWWISACRVACRVACGEADWYKAKFRL